MWSNKPMGMRCIYREIRSPMEDGSRTIEMHCTPKIPNSNFSLPNTHTAPSIEYRSNIGTNETFGGSNKFQDKIDQQNQKFAENAARIEKAINMGGFSNPTQRHYEHDFDITGVMDYHGRCNSKNVKALSDLVNIRSTMKPGWGHNVFKNIQVLDLSRNGLTDADLWPLCNSMYYQDIKIKFLNLGNNKIQYVGGILDGVGSYTRPGDGTKQIHNVETLILNNNLLDDSCAKNISDHIQAGFLKATKHIDVSGNKITTKGEGLFVKAMQSKYVQDLIVKTKALDQSFKMFAGSNEEKKVVYKYFIQLAKEKGINTDGIVAEKSFVNAMKFNYPFAKACIGYIKCRHFPNDPIDYAKGELKNQMIAKLPKSMSKSINKIEDIDSKV